LKKLLPFYIIFLSYAVVMGILLIIYPKGTMELWVNKHVRFDAGFYWITFLGDGIFFVLVSLLIAWYHKRWGLFAFVCFAVTGILAQFLKGMVFSDSPRPQAFFGESVPLHYVAGVIIHTSNSFPSGHTISAFSLATVLSLYGRQGWIGPVCILCAILVGFSRVYLLQHFFIDTYFGACIGVSITLLLFQISKKQIQKTERWGDWAYRKNQN